MERSLAAAAFVIGLLVHQIASAADWSPLEPIDPQVCNVPATNDPGWAENPIDGFILARLKAEGLEPAPEASRREWLRRVTFDLIGLPPTPEEMAAFLQDERPDPIAYAAVVDRLLASPHYGERWARHWLDVVRYADTDGFAIDEERPRLWRYRDYVIRHFNEDRPYGQFVREQIAGDELKDAGPEALIATSFYRLGPYEADNMTPENRQQDYLNEITTTIGTAFLGMTVGCARCHDHKYDPIPQADFYRLQAFVRAVSRGEIEAEFLAEELTPGVAARKAAVEAELAQKEQELEAHRQALLEKLASALQVASSDVPKDTFNKALKGEAISLPEPEERPPAPPGQQEERKFEFSKEDREKFENLKKAIDENIDKKRFSPLVDSVRIRRWRGSNPETHVLLNGDPFAPGDLVQPGCLSAVDEWSPDLTQQINATSEKADGRRRVLAEWIASPQNPLTMRVYVNRIWQFHFGAGIVATANDFGENGSGASHPELLDYLAKSFVEQGEHTKPLHKLIVLSRTYRSSSQHPDAKHCASVDFENRLLWRAPLRRLEAEVIRDSLLAVSGRLNTERGGPGFYEQLPDGLPSEYPFFQWHPSSDDQRRRRSVYMFQRRNLVHPLMEAFDVADSSQSCERRARSVTAAQSLTLINGQLAADAALQLARRLQDDCGSEVPARIQRLFELVLARPATAEELTECASFLSQKTERYQQRANEKTDKAEAEAPPELLALRDLCLVTLNSNEFLYLE